MTRPRQSRGTVSLVALCFVAVLGISLASYLTICTRAMQLSNRSYQSGLGQQLAELGLEEGLRAFNKGDWGGWSANPSGVTGATTAWTPDATYKRMSRTLTFDSTRLGQNVTATVKIRVDNYDANVLGADFNSSATYRVGDRTGSGALWARAVSTSFSGQTPTASGNLRYWAPDPVESQWATGVSYSVYDVVNYNGQWRRCHTSHVSSSSILPSNTNYWASIPISSSISLSYNSTFSYSRGAMVFSNGVWYYSINGSNLGNTPPNATWWAALPTPTADTWSGSSTYSTGDYVYYFGVWYRYTNIPSWASSSAPFISWMYRSGATYRFNDLVYYSTTGSGTWYRCVVASTTNVPTSTDWQDAMSGDMHAWSSASITYNPGDVVYYSNQWYRCIRSHSSTSITPTNTTYWATTPLLSQDWQPNHQYSANDTVRYKGIWYLCLSGNNNQIPTNASSAFWAAAPQSLPPWDSTTYYEVDDLVNNSGTWYRCIAPHKGQTPPNTTYWTVLTGSGSSYVWNAGTAYAVGAYRSYGGVWYKCITATAANDGHTPNDSGYWSAAWAQPSNNSVTTGAPVVYAESTITIAGSPPIKTQVRATIAPSPLFPNAVGASSTVTLSSGGTIDSYDGSVRAQNTDGSWSTYSYNDQSISPFSGTNANIGNLAFLAATGTTSPSVTVTSPTVKGFVAATPASSSPFAPLASFGTSSSLLNSDGTATSPDTTATNVDLSRISRSPYVPQFTSLPSAGLTSAFSLTSFPRGLLLVEPSGSGNTVSIGSPGSTAPSRYYYNGDLTLGGTASISTLNIDGPVILFINGSLTMNGTPNGVININTSGSAEIHIATGLNATVASDGIRNLTYDPKKLILIMDTASSNALTYSDGTGSPNNFYGVIYAPNTTNSTGLLFDNSNTNIQGAVSAKKVNFSNNATVHYDTSLRYATFGGVDQPYTVTQWRELPQTEQATMP